jgi:hypothetical protein
MPEMMVIRIDEAETGTTSAPTTVAHGIATPTSYARKYSRWMTEIVATSATTPTLTTGLGFPGDVDDEVHLLCRAAAASGNVQFQVRVHAYLSKLIDKTLDTPVASSNGWYEVFDTELVIRSANFNMAFPIKLV